MAQPTNLTVISQTGKIAHQAERSKVGGCRSQRAAAAAALAAAAARADSPAAVAAAVLGRRLPGRLSAASSF